MFYVVNLERQVDVQPRMFGPSLRDNIMEQVRREAQGTVDPSVGYIVSIEDVQLMGKGVLRSDGSGLATFNVAYRAITMRLWPEEVIDCEVKIVKSAGLWCTAGPYKIFVSEKHLPDDYMLRNVDGQEIWVSEAVEGGIEIREQSHIRVRMANVQLQPGHVAGVATMKGHCLGVINMQRSSRFDMCRTGSNW
eukprot:TRINITY_DN15477_c0_g1_i1.p1 TRINITY_DN15477_c0_g1~~TRINITY_DN15477_c0_g1_i1.p1  ORF type:complete len:192 (-),score=10.36 TRINITY_DN15477_c0_g1_i1:513-1088(-)